MIQPVTRYCHICGLTHELGAIAPQTNCTDALKAEVARLRGVLARWQAAGQMLAEAEYELPADVASISNDHRVIIDATWPRASTA